MKIYDEDGQTRVAPTSVLLTSAYLSKMGRAGGNARAANMSPAKRSKIARKAAKARWHQRRREKMESGNDPRAV